MHASAIIAHMPLFEKALLMVTLLPQDSRVSSVTAP